MATPKNYLLVSGASLAADYTSAAIDATFYFTLSIQAIWTGSPVGNFTLQVSNDGTNYDTVVGTTVAAGGAAGTTVYEYTTCPSKWYRLKYTSTSSTGVLSIQVNGKTV